MNTVQQRPIRGAIFGIWTRPSVVAALQPLLGAVVCDFSTEVWIQVSNWPSCSCACSWIGRTPLHEFGSNLTRLHPSAAQVWIEKRTRRVAIAHRTNTRTHTNASRRSRRCRKRPGNRTYKLRDSHTGDCLLINPDSETTATTNQRSPPCLCLRLHHTAEQIAGLCTADLL
jgi:hypothetical protein